jgi:hypothetical protein
MFAYGSNMLAGRIQLRCPSATALGMAELHGHDLHWHKRSADGSGKCDVVKSDEPSSIVFGVLYRLSAAEKSALDRAEGLGSGYAEKSVKLVLNGEARDAVVYYATCVSSELRPYKWYKALVMAGAREHGLPEHYIARIEATEAMEDPDKARHESKMRLLKTRGDAIRP